VIAPVLVAWLGMGPALAAPRSLATTGVRSELRFRKGQDVETGVGNETGWDVDTTGTAGLAFDWRRTQLALTYMPRLVFTDFAGPEASRDFTQAANLALTFQGRSYTLVLSQQGEYGRRRFTALERAETNPTTGMPITNTVPASTSVLYAASVTQASLRLLLTRRSELTLTASYTINGGVDAESRRTLPLVVGPRFDSAWAYAVTARDSLGLTLSASWLKSLGSTDTDTANGMDNVLAEDVNTGVVTFGQRWDRAWRPELKSSLWVGEALLFERGRSAQVLPQAFGTLTRAFAGSSEHGALEVSLGAGTAIDTDRVTGTARPYVRGTLQVAWTAYPLRTYVLGGALKTIGASETNAATTFNAEAGASYNFIRPLALELGTRVSDQSIDSPTTTSAAAADTGFAFAAFVALAWRPEPWPL
jgi:opacity protein-like surface antigen